MHNKSKIDCLPEELQEKIYRFIHQDFLNDVNLEIKHKKTNVKKIYSNTIYKYFLNCEMSNTTVRTFHVYIDFKKGKRMNIPEDNVYIKMDLFFW